MPALAFEIRVCQNPDCGLRYPLTDNNKFGDRCPVCLSQTIVATNKRLEREALREEPFSGTSASKHVFLDNVRSAWNVGSILRSADAFDFRHVYICGITPTPDVSEVTKTSLGAENYVRWSTHKNGLKLASRLRDEGSQLWALELTQESIPINRVSISLDRSRPHVLVVGNEVAGVDPGILEIADRIIYIPMKGQKRSLNVAVAFAIAAQIMNSLFALTG